MGKNELEFAFFCPKRSTEPWLPSTAIQQSTRDFYETYYQDNISGTNVQNYYQSVSAELLSLGELLDGIADEEEVRNKAKISCKYEKKKQNYRKRNLKRQNFYFLKLFRAMEMICLFNVGMDFFFLE